MVTLSNHGGSCCGARHIYGFGTGDTLQNITEMHNKVAETPDRLTEIILNKQQCRSSPNLLASMAERGFVLTTGFKNGNHDSDVFVFHRSDRRLRLDDTERDFGFVWPGQVAQPTLHGYLTPLVTGGGNGDRNIQRGSRIYPHFFQQYPRDMVLAYVGPSPDLRNTTFILGEQYQGWQAATVRINHLSYIKVLNRVTGRTHTLALSSFQIHQVTQTPLLTFLTPAPDLGNQRYEIDANEQPRVIDAVDRIVYTTYHNVYRDGRIGAGYPTSQEARNASPRALNRLTRHIYNTGRVEDVQNQEG